MTRRTYLQAAETTVALLADPAVGAAWQEPSALPEFGVGGLAGHLARQVLHVAEILAEDVPDRQPVSLLDHYTGARWVGAPVDDEVSVHVRRGGETVAADGQAALARRVRAEVDRLATVLPAEPADRRVYLPWAGWSLTLDDFLVTRLLEIAVHCDDLAVSVGVETPVLPGTALDPVLGLLTRLAVHRHGAIPVLRALSRAGRAPATIAAI